MESQELTASSMLEWLAACATTEDLEKCLEAVRTHLPIWSVLSDIRELIKHLHHHAVHFNRLAEFQSGPLEVRQETPLIQRVINAIGGTALLLSKELRLHLSMSQTLIELWNALCAYQARLATMGTSSYHVYKAGLAMYIAYVYLDQRDPGATMWWLLLAQADDLLHEHGEGGGAGKDMLLLTFGVNDEIFMEMESIVRRCLASKSAHQLYAEYVVMELSLIPKCLWLFSTTVVVMVRQAANDGENGSTWR